jgi:hypothetical protein
MAIWQDQDKSRDYGSGILHPYLSLKPYNHHDKSPHGENDADSEKQNLNALLPSDCPNTGNKSRDGLRFGKELPPGCFAKSYIRDTNREKKPSE